MKKFIPGLLAMLLCFGMATGCSILGGGESATDSSAPASTESATTSSTDNTESTETPDSVDSTDSSDNGGSTETPSAHETDLTDVKDYLIGVMGDKELNTRKDFTVINTYSFFGETTSYTITWTVDVADITITKGTGTDTIVIPEVDVDTPYVLTATITDPDGCHTTTATFNGTVLAALSLVPSKIAQAPVENTVYKLYVYQTEKAIDCYFTGAMAATYYFGTTENYEEGVDMYVEYVDATNFNLFFNKEDGTKTYIGVKEAWNSKNSYWTFNVYMDTVPVSQFSWNAELGTIVTTVPCRSDEDNKNQAATEQTSTATLYLGNYSDKTTFSASKLEKASSSNVGGLVEMVSKGSFTPDVKVNTEAEKLSIENTFYGDATLELPTTGKTYADVAINWAVKSGENVSITNNVLTVTAPASETTAVITATLTCGDITVSVDVELAVNAAVFTPQNGDTLTIPQALEYGATLSSGASTTDKFYVAGTITGFYGSSALTYGNVYITDDNNNTILVYGLFSEDGSTRYDAMTTKPVEGDYIKVYGVLNNYNGTAQFKNAWLMEHTPAGGNNDNVGGDDNDTPTYNTAADILNALYALADGESLTGEFTLTGKITALDGYNNPTIVVEGFESMPVYCYRLQVTNAIDDVITVTATSMKNYQGTYEFMNCTLVTEAGDDDNNDDNTNTDNTDPAPAGAPVVGTSYYMTNNASAAFATAMSDNGKFLVTGSAAGSLTVIFELVEGTTDTYTIKLSNGKYLNAATSGNYIAFGDTATTQWVVDATSKKIMQSGSTFALMYNSEYNRITRYDTTKTSITDYAWFADVE